MSDEEADVDARESTVGIDDRQVAFVALVLIALAIAAVAAPAATGSGGAGPGSGVGPGGGGDAGPDATPGGQGGDPGGAPGEQTDGSDDSDDSDDSPGISFDWGELLDRLFSNGQSTRTHQPEEADGRRCTISLEREPIPGAETTVTVRYGDEPLSDAPVWFNGRRIGETDRFGRVNGTIPYDRELRVVVEIRGRPPCRTVVTLPEADRPASVAEGPSDMSAGFAGRGAAPSTVDGEARAVGDRGATTIGTRNAYAPPDSEPNPNATASYAVEGDVFIDVEGDAYPGAVLTVDATIRGVPVHGGRVTVDGERVGTTNETGVSTVPVPDDGSEQFEIRVERGDFVGFTTVDVLLLEVSLDPEHLSLVPGQGATVEATVGKVPVTGADVTVDGTHRGRTGPDGRRFVELPLDPTAPIAVSTERQTASVSLLDVYGPLGAFLFVLASVLGGISYRVRGARGATGAVGGVLALVLAWGLVVLADVLWGSAGSTAAVVVVVALAFAAALFRWRTELGQAIGKGSDLSGRLLDLAARVGRLVLRPDRLALALVGIPRRFATRVGALARRIGDRLLGITLGVVGVVERTVDRVLGGLTRVVSWAVSALGSLRSLGSLPGRVRTALLGRSPATVAGVLLTALAPVGGYVLGDERGVAAVAAAIGLLAVGRWLFVRYARGPTASDPGGGPANGPGDGQEATAATPGSAAGMTGGESRSFRDVWRAFARLVSPDRWRSRTPTEVAQAAIEQGYPGGPVRELTRLFAEVEYGGRAPSEPVRRRAVAAYEEAVDLAVGDTEESGGDTPASGRETEGSGGGES